MPSDDEMKAWMQTEEGFASVARIINETIFNDAILIDNTGVREIVEEAYRRRATDGRRGDGGQTT